jgi:hypothetical protein
MIEQEKRLAELKKEVPTRGFKRHPIILKDICDLAPELQSPAVTELAAHEPLRTIIAFPAQIHRGWHYVSKQALLFTPTEVIHLVASIWPDQEPEVTLLRGSDLIYMNVTLILLYGYLEVVAHGCGSPARLNVEFNTVAWYQLSSPLMKLLEASKPSSSIWTDTAICSPAAQQAIEKLPLKFSNGLQIYGLLPGEGLEDLVFQAGTWKPRLLFFRKALTANTLLMITTNYVVVIKEELEISHGWILTYIPRNCIGGIQNQPLSLLNVLTVHLKRGEQTAEYKLLLDNASTQDWRKKWIGHGLQWEDLPMADRSSSMRA